MIMKVHSMPTFTRKLLPLLTLSVLAACGGGGSGSSGSAPSQNNNASARYHVAGQVQKGPFIFGSQIWISELDDKLSPTGKVYMTQTKDDLGNFGIPGSVNTKLVELTGSGYYMNELTGTLSTAPVTLNAVADLSVSKSLTINLLTTLQAPRLKALMAGGSDYQTAYNQSRNEVLAVFGIDPAKVDSLGSLFDMRINGNADQDSILLATSVILSQAAKNQALQANTDTAELSHLISTIASDLANNGKLSSQSLQDQLSVAATQIDLDAVRRNVETYYTKRGIQLVAPKFEEWIDKDNSQTIPRRLVPTSGLSFQDSADANPEQIYSSNAVKISGLKDGQAAILRLNGTGTLLKNDKAVTTDSFVKNNDVIQLKDAAPSFNEEKSNTVQIGSSTATWKIKSASTHLRIDDQNGGLFPAPGVEQAYIFLHQSQFIAFRFTPSADFIAKYSGVDVNAVGGAVVSNLSIYSDNNNNPDQALITSNEKTSLYKKLITGGSVREFIPNSVQYRLGSSGVQLKANKNYWIVLAMTVPDFPMAGLQGGKGKTSQYDGTLKLSKNGTMWCSQPSERDTPCFNNYISPASFWLAD
ncbi:hypothetical protein AWB61_11715 [Chromobacterium sp. F49]|nr:hypothetical protein Cv017_05170 [Chromobacterium subtsugae]KZE87020.1 hypothetical protein AWB61_11715 [Chromobacterium sp. F49]